VHNDVQAEFSTEVTWLVQSEFILVDKMVLNQIV
jgi:hypothetical protein